MTHLQTKTGATTCLPMIESRRGRQHRAHRTSDMQAPSQSQPESSTFVSRFGVAGLSGVVRSLTETMIAGWDELPVGRRVPADRSVAALKADVKHDKKQPVQHVMRLAVAAIDAGIPVVRVTQWFRDAVAYLEGYAARRERRQSSRVLSFPARWARVWTRETREQAEADCSAIAVGDGTDVNALRCARVELQEHREEVDNQLALLSEQIAALELEAVR